MVEESSREKPKGEVGAHRDDKEWQVKREVLVISHHSVRLDHGCISKLGAATAEGEKDRNANNKGCLSFPVLPPMTSSLNSKCLGPREIPY